MLSSMTPEQFKRALTALGLDLDTTAVLLGVTVRSVRRWLDGSRKVPWPVVRFLQYLTVTKTSGAAAIKRLDE